MHEYGEFGDEFDDIDEAALIAATVQVEAQSRLASFSFQSRGGSVDSPGKDFGDNDHYSQRQSAQNTREPNGTSLRQRTLTGAILCENIRPTPSQGASSRPRQESQLPMASNRYPLIANQNQELPTHHRLDLDAAKTWVYPTNLTHRDYQFNIVQGGLFNNLLVALPTGLGKTFIAAVVMLNWYRWAPEGHIIFLAPTKPLVDQQIDACYNIAGIPRSQTIELTGRVPRKIRAEHWKEKRIFFGTPQTIENDLKYGLADPKKIICVVVDEAHKAKGNYASANVVRFIRRFNSSFRVLGLTATPGSTVDSIQGVIDALGVSRIEIRTEDSLDIRQYTHQKDIQTVTIELSPELNELKELCIGCMQPFLDELKSKRACYIVDAEKIQLFALLSARREWLMTRAAREMPDALKGAIQHTFALLMSLAHPFTLLIYHGVRSFYSNMKVVLAEFESSKSKLKQRLLGNPKLKQLMERADEFMASPTFSEHPKLDYLVNVLLQHFMESEENGRRDTRVMVFSSYRDSAEEIVRALKQHEPQIKPHIFVGQAESKSGQAGMGQAEQQGVYILILNCVDPMFDSGYQVIRKLKDGVYNTLVATSIGEEGLDIGEIDLIACYDSQASPIRMLQRMGRTGRKREGKVLLLLTKGKEEDSYAKAKDNYLSIQKKIVSGEQLTFHHDLSPRILPREIVPVVEKSLITPPVEAPEPPKTRGRKKLPPKKFHMPGGVNTGFIKASRIGRSAEILSNDERVEQEVYSSDAESLAPDYPDHSSSLGLLDGEQEKELQRRYMEVRGHEEEIFIAIPRMDAYPECQRTLTSTRLVGHGRTTRMMVNLLNDIRKYQEDPSKLEGLRESLKEEDLATEQVSMTPSPAGALRSTAKATTNRQKFIPKTNIKKSMGWKKAKESVFSPSPLETENEATVIDIMSTPENIGDSPSPSSLQNARDIVLLASPGLDLGSDDDDDDDLPDAAVLIKRATAPARSNVLSTRRVRKKRRILGSDDGEEV